MCVMSEAASVERRQIMRVLGAKVILTPANLKGTALMEKTMVSAILNHPRVVVVGVFLTCVFYTNHLYSSVVHRRELS